MKLCIGKVERASRNHVQRASFLQLRTRRARRGAAMLLIVAWTMLWESWFRAD